MMRALQRLRPLAALLALTSLSASVWIRIPPWNAWTHVLAVGAPELSPWLLVGAVLAFGLALLDARHNWIARVSLVCSATAILLSATLLAGLGATTQAFDLEMTRTLGSNYLAAVPADVRAKLRPSPINLRDAFRVYQRDADTVHVDRGVPVTIHDGVPLTADVYRVADAIHRPVVLQFYSGAWRSGGPSDNDALSRALAAAGFVVVAGDYRHAPDWTWPAQLRDVEAALAWIAAHGEEHGADPTRVVLLGRSAGAQLAFIAGVNVTSPAIRGIVAIYSPVDLTDGYVHPPMPDVLGSRSLESAFLGGTPDDRSDAYRNASPITYADRPHPPVLLIHGGRDIIVTPGFARRLHAQLAKSGIAPYLEIPWAGHAFDTIPFGPSGQLELYYTERFLAWATSGTAGDAKNN